MSLMLRNKGALLLLMFNIFLSFAGIGLVMPIMPTYMNELGLNGRAMGLLVAAFSVTQLLFSPLAGRLADQYGRKKLIVTGMFIFAVSELLFGTASSVPLLFVSRMLGGIGAAFLTPAVMAYIADITTEEERAKGMGYISAAISTGFIIGPGIGGLIAQYGMRAPFYCAAAAAGIAGVITLLVLKESLKEEQRIKAGSGDRQSESLLNQFMTSYQAPYFIGLVIVFVFTFGLANFETVFGLYVDHKFSFTPKDIAVIITFGSILGAVVQVTVFGALLKRFGEKNVIYASLAVAGLFIIVVTFVSSYWMIMVVTFIIFLATDILRPTVSTLMSKLAGEEQGFVAGMNSSYTSLGNIAGPIIAGILFDFNINLPYLFAAVVLFICLAVTVKSGVRSGRALGGYGEKLEL